MIVLENASIGFGISPLAQHFAIHGDALGGGFELALGCDARLAVRSAVVGLPEVTLGMIPGAGGTQRLTRRVGIARAIELICTGKRVSAPEALQLGLLDQVVEQDLLTSAVDLTHKLQGKKCRIADETVPVNTAEQIQAAEQAALRVGRHRPQVIAAIEAIRWAATLPVEEALRAERAAFNSLRLRSDAYALRHQFFAERNAMKLPAELQATPRSFSKMAVIGAGTMGTGIAIAALDAALEVMLLEQNAEALERGRQRIESHYRSREESGKMRAEIAQSALGRLRCSLHWPDLAEADLVIEAVFEDLQVKQEVFRQLDAHARPGAVLATNTSYLDIDRIAQATGRPQDVVGLHFFSPANVMKLLEVVRGAQTSPDVLATGMALGKAMKKLPVLCGNAFGFIGLCRVVGL